MEPRIEALLEAMTLEEQVALLAGADFWTTVPIPRLGIPAIKVSDGPNGARGGGALIGGVRAAAFPVAIALASTWDTGLVEQIGRALAEEVHSKGARVLLAPTVNIHRSPLNGRNFECYSEDPFLAARMAVAYIVGLQSRGVSATVKHYIGNESEFERMTISSEIGARALREIYLPPFDAAVHEAGSWALMSSYNKVNGTYVGEHPGLLRDLLKGEWAYDGLVMSDWMATHSTAEAAAAGLDLEMPGPTLHRGRQLVEAVQAGQVSREAIRDSARRVLRLIARVGGFESPAIPDERADDRPAHRALIRRAGAEGTVLLKNSGVLPLDPQRPQTIAIIGPNARTAQIMGGGSAQVNAHYRIAPYDGVAAQVGPAATLRYAPGCTNHKLLPLLGRPMRVRYFNSPDLAGPAVAEAEAPESELMWLHDVPAGVDRAGFSARLSARFTPEADGEQLFSLVSAGKSRLYLDGDLLIDNWDGWRPGDSYFGGGSLEVIAPAQLAAGRSYELAVEYTCPTEGRLGIRAVRLGALRPLGDAAIVEAAALASTSDLALVFVGLTGEWDSEGADRPHMDLVGRQNELVAQVAAANPNTVVVLQSGGPLSMPWLDQVAAVLQAWYPGQECGNAIADVLFGKVNPAGRLPQTFPARLEDNPAYDNYPGAGGRVHYAEGIFVGYRHYEARQIAPLFPFGFGLSYTSFSYGELRLSARAIGPGERLRATVAVTNSGERAGHEVVQLYVADPQARLPRPPKELKGFAKVALAPGETREVTLELDMRALAYYDDARATWVAEAGDFAVLVGGSSQDIRARAEFTLRAEWAQA